jgi:FlaG/FlaF family flagellin (archaellin)
MARGVSSVIGVALLALVTVILALSVVVIATADSPEPMPSARFSSDVSAADQQITIHHDGGDPISSGAIDLRITVDGEPLGHQPPVPFFAAEGFVSGPTGPINPAGSDEWTAGSTATLQVATTNEPQITAGATVKITIATQHGIIYEETVTAT